MAVPTMPAWLPSYCPHGMVAILLPPFNCFDGSLIAIPMIRRHRHGITASSRPILFLIPHHHRHGIVPFSSALPCSLAAALSLVTHRWVTCPCPTS